MHFIWKIDRRLEVVDLLLVSDFFARLEVGVLGDIARDRNSLTSAMPIFRWELHSTVSEAPQSVGIVVGLISSRSHLDDTHSIGASPAIQEKNKM